MINLSTINSQESAKLSALRIWKQIFSYNFLGQPHLDSGRNNPDHIADILVLTQDKRWVYKGKPKRLVLTNLSYAATYDVLSYFDVENDNDDVLHTIIESLFDGDEVKKDIIYELMDKIRDKFMSLLPYPIVYTHIDEPESQEDKMGDFCWSRMDGDYRKRTLFNILWLNRWLEFEILKLEQNGSDDYEGEEDEEDYSEEEETLDFEEIDVSLAAWADHMDNGYDDLIRRILDLKAKTAKVKKIN